MKIWADFHTHTRYSHGTGTIKDNVEAAVKAGLSAVGISEHGPSNWFMGPRISDFDKMREEVNELRRTYNNINIYLGCEANIVSIDGRLDIPERVLKKLDYVMAGLHPMVWPSSFKDGIFLIVDNMLSRHNLNFKLKALEQNTKALIKAIQNYNINVITHPGLHLAIDTAALAEAAAKAGTALEINAGHSFMTEEYVKIAKAFGVKFIIGSDAHHPRDVGNFQKGIYIAERSGLTPDDIINAKPTVSPEPLSVSY